MTKEQLAKEIKKLKVDVDVELFEHLMKDTLATNELFNLTSITDEDKFRELMIYDSLTPNRLIDFSGREVLDFGTGGGYPGLPLAIATKGKFSLLDSTKKKIYHVNDYAKANNLTNVRCLYTRGEEYTMKFREKYDVVIARAVADLRVLLEMVVPAIKVGGFFIAMKGAQGDIELIKSERALNKLSCKVIDVDEFELPESKEKRMNILIQKTKETKPKYPRSYNEIIKKPL